MKDDWTKSPAKSFVILGMLQNRASISSSEWRGSRAGLLGRKFPGLNFHDMWLMITVDLAL